MQLKSLPGSQSTHEAEGLIADLLGGWIDGWLVGWFCQVLRLVKADQQMLFKSS